LTLAPVVEHNGSMRYRRLSYRYAMVLRIGRLQPFGDIWQTDRLRHFVQARWRPDADAYETARTVEITVDVSGVDEDDFEVQLYDDVLVVQGVRQLRPVPEPARYHAAGIRQGPFQVELPLPAPVDPGKVEARYERGLLRVTLAKRGEAE
jgi:HSP20 family protein